MQTRREKWRDWAHQFLFFGDQDVSGHFLKDSSIAITPILVIYTSSWHNPLGVSVCKCAIPITMRCYLAWLRDVKSRLWFPSPPLRAHCRGPSKGMPGCHGVPPQPRDHRRWTELHAEFTDHLAVCYQARHVTGSSREGKHQMKGFRTRHHRDLAYSCGPGCDQARECCDARREAR